MTKALALSLLLLASCGGGPDVSHRVTVRRYEDASGEPVRDGVRLGFTYFIDRSGAADGADGWNCLVSDVLLLDADADKVVRVTMHELLNVLVEDSGAPPYGPGWYSFDSDTLPPLSPVLPEEGAWIAAHGTYDVSAQDGWLVEPVAEAARRLDEAAGKEIFHVR